MRKFVIAVGMTALLIAGGNLRGDEFLEKLALYVPNRIVDTLDAFSLNLGVGPVIRAELMATRAVTVGGSCGLTWKAIKDYNRQYGVGMQDGWYWSLAVVGEEDMRRERAVGTVKSYWEACAGFPIPTQRIYNPLEGARDYWQFGGALGALIEGEFYIHPIEGLDWLAGFFFLDPKKDDLTFDDFR